MFCTNAHCPGRKASGSVQDQDGADCLHCKKPLSDPKDALRGLEAALKNLEGYEIQLEAGMASGDGLAERVLGSNGRVSDALMAFARAAIQEELKEERSYIQECRESLKAQLAWHKQSSRVPFQEALKTLRAEVASKAAREATDSVKALARREYHAAIRLMLMSRGFIVAPEDTALGAVFPRNEWLRDMVSESQFLASAKSISDGLMTRYALLGDAQFSLNRLLSFGTDTLRDFHHTVGCICVSWTRHQGESGPVYVPVLGVSSVSKADPDAEYFGRYGRHLGLPNFERCAPLPDFEERGYNSSAAYTRGVAEIREKHTGTGPELGVKMRQFAEDAREAHRIELPKQRVAHALNFNYETMIHRTNLAALGYRARTLLKLRRPARQALMSYVSFAEVGSIGVKETSMETPQVAPGVDLSLAHWHSLNCAEPAALMTASSYFCEGADVLVCFPYEGINDVGDFCNRPKETCPWCAAVELGFRSVSPNPNGPASGIKSGDWSTQYTLPLRDEPSSTLSTGADFDAFSSENEVMRATLKTLAGLESLGLVKNNDMKSAAYSSVVQTKIGRVRSMYYLLGLLDREVVALDRPMFRYAEGVF
ncbi:hypothetical protein LXT21_39090 [Myxococcus sp. K38C18041901]|uniref:hypothetical protein n=1 Tax=Myxococcus guangdongensis TaxID=2906760 RepID=UPI0020A7B093|nr:hypothetical protein [Myxococcus guangdongensis]MCP3064795.1 hypothetical protein [Myxococcus guangdongensis]